MSITISMDYDIRDRHVELAKECIGGLRTQLAAVESQIFTYGQTTTADLWQQHETIQKSIYSLETMIEMLGHTL